MQDNYNALMNTSIKTFTTEQIQEVVKDAGQPKFRAKQLQEWLHKHHALSYDEMTNLPQGFRTYLETHFPLYRPLVEDQQISQDGTRKYVIRLIDNNFVETVGIPSSHGNRLTVCVSSQVGCAMQCQFCATGKEGFKRNLTADEITDQVALVERDFQKPVTNVVVMGQGEPFLNYENLILALKELNNPDSFNIGARHITVSSCGILEGIRAFSEEPYQFTLAISLHSALQPDRDILMPRVKNQPLNELKRTIQEYISSTNRRVTFEYLLIDGLNDTDKHLKALTAFCDDILCHVNLLPVNNIEGSPFKPPTNSTLNKWVNTLNSSGVETTIRNSRGSDIAGACGQLKNKLK